MRPFGEEAGLELGIIKIAEQVAPAHWRPADGSPIRRARTLTSAYEYDIFICMRTTLVLKDEVLAKASVLTGIKEKTALVHLGLEALIAKASAARLAKLGGTEKRLTSIPRRRAA